MIPVRRKGPEFTSACEPFARERKQLATANTPYLTVVHGGPKAPTKTLG